MASVFKSLLSLFGAGRQSSGSEPAAAAAIEYKGFAIRAAPFLEGGQYQTAGVIAKEIDGVMKEHHFIRADRYAALDDAIAFTQAKARQIIDEHERLPRNLFDR